MPSFNTFLSDKSLKLLYLADSGSGKTGSLTSLACAGYKLRILDFDNGLDPLYHFVQDQCPEALSNISYETLINDPFTKKKPAFDRALSLLSNWRTGGDDFGSASTWGRDTVLIIDSLSMAGKAALEKKRADSPEKDARMEYFHAQNSVESLLSAVCSQSTPCHVIITAHLQFSELDDGTVKRVPLSTVGNKFSVVPPRYFNTTITAESRGGWPQVAPSDRHEIHRGA